MLLVSICGLLVTLLTADSFLLNFLSTPAADALVLGLLTVGACWVFLIPAAMSKNFRRRLQAMRRASTAGSVHAWLFVLFVSLFFVALLRAGIAHSISVPAALYNSAKWGAAILILLGAAVSRKRERRQWFVVQMLAWSLSVYSLLNILLIVLGVRNSLADRQYLTNAGDGLLFGILGLRVSRLPLPIGGAINGAGLPVAIGVAIGIVIAVYAKERRVRRFAMLVGVSSFLCVMITDSRGGAFAALIAASIIIVMPRSRLVAARWLAIAAPVFPLALTAATVALGGSAWLMALSRSADANSGALSGRPLIWAVVAAHFSRFEPVHLIGYGALGQIASRVGDKYASVFERDYESANTNGAHNIVLQALLDVGYVGALIQILLLFVVIQALGRRVAKSSGKQFSWDAAALVGAIYIIFAGMTGEAVSFTTPVTLTAFLALNIHVLFSPGIEIREDDERVHAFRSQPATRGQEVEINRLARPRRSWIAKSRR